MSRTVGARGPLLALAALRSGLRMLQRERELWVVAAGPVMVSLASFALAVALLLASVDPLTLWLRAHLAVGDPSGWYGWLWVGPLRALAWLARWITLAVVAVALYLLCSVATGILAAPFLEVLSRRVERLQTGNVVERGRPGPLGAIASGARSAWEEGKRVGFFFLVQSVLLAAGLVPGMQPLALTLGIAFTVLFLPLDYLGYLFDRREVRFRDRRRWVWRNRFPVGVLGGAALLTFAIPGLNLLVLPWLVTACTLLGLEIGLPEPESSQLRASSRAASR